MTREDLIREYTDLYEKRKGIRAAFAELEERMEDLRREFNKDTAWMEAISDRFDMLYGCRSNYPDKIPYHLHVYLDKGEEVPE